MTRRTASIIGGIGRTLITLGLLVLGFAAFQLWGTAWQESRNQSELQQDFAERRAELAARAPELFATTTTASPSDGESTDATTDATTTPATTPPTTVAPEVLAELAAEFLPEQGESLGTIKIPSIGVDKEIVHGTRRDDLRQGPGHYPTTPFPGQAGNTAIAGHRTTYGSPFGDLDLVEPGDEIVVETLWGTYYYEVLPHIGPDGSDVGYFIVDDSAVEVVEDQGDNRLTLTACHPKYSAAQRIIVSAELVSAPAPPLPIPAAVAPVINEAGADDGDGDGDPTITEFVAAENVLDASLGWNTEERTPALLWGTAAALVALAGWLLGRAWKRWPAYAMISPVLLYALWGCFTHLDKMLPAL